MENPQADLVRHAFLLGHASAGNFNDATEAFDLLLSYVYADRSPSSFLRWLAILSTCDWDEVMDEVG